jgi:hypothetical protein
LSTNKFMLVTRGEGKPQPPPAYPTFFSKKKKKTL